MKLTLLLLLAAGLPLLAGDSPKAKHAQAPEAMVAVGNYDFQDHEAGKAINTALRAAGINFDVLTGPGATIDVDEADAATARAVLEKLIATQHVAVRVTKAAPAKPKK